MRQRVPRLGGAGDAGAEPAGRISGGSRGSDSRRPPAVAPFPRVLPRPRGECGPGAGAGWGRQPGGEGRREAAAFRPGAGAGARRALPARGRFYVRGEPWPWDSRAAAGFRAERCGGRTELWRRPRGVYSRVPGAGRGSGEPCPPGCGVPEPGAARPLVLLGVRAGLSAQSRGLCWRLRDAFPSWSLPWLWTDLTLRRSVPA